MALPLWCWLFLLPATAWAEAPRLRVHRDARSAAAAQAAAVPTTEATVVWNTTVWAPITSAPVLSADNSTIYLAANMTMICLNATTGTMLWTTPVVKGPIRGLSIGSMPDGRPVVFVNGNNQSLYAMEGVKGKVQWSYLPLGKIHGSPTVTADNKKLYATASIHASSNSTLSNLHGIAALDAVTGKNIWRRAISYTDTYKLSRSVVVSSNGSNMYIMDYSFDVFAIDWDSNQTWTAPAAGGEDESTPLSEKPPIVLGKGDQVLFAATKDGVRALRTDNGKEVWIAKLSGGATVSSLVESRDGHILYALTNTGAIRSLSTTDGKVAKDSLNDAASGGGAVTKAKDIVPDFARDRMYYTDGEGSIVVYDLGRRVAGHKLTGLPAAAYKKGAYSPVIATEADGKQYLYYASTQGDIFKLAAPETM